MMFVILGVKSEFWLREQQRCREGLASHVGGGSASRRADGNTTFTFRSWRIDRSEGAATGRQMLNDLQQWPRLAVCVCVCVLETSPGALR